MSIRRACCCWQQQSVMETRSGASPSSCRLPSRVLEDTSDPRLNQPVQKEPLEKKTRFRWSRSSESRFQTCFTTDVQDYLLKNKIKNKQKQNNQSTQEPRHQYRKLIHIGLRTQLLLFLIYLIRHWIRRTNTTLMLLWEVRQNAPSMTKIAETKI